MKLSFYGGTGTVTGANFLLETKGGKYLIDCGLIQGSKEADLLNRDPFIYNPSEIDFLFVTHAHTDHIGRIPKLVKDGFAGKIVSTPETKDIAMHILEDTLGILEDEARKEGVLPLFEREDLDKAFSMWQTLPYHTKADFGDISLYIKDSGHILGSGMLEISTEDKKIVFTGDLGNSPSLLLNDTEDITDADYIVMESVYGDRNHEPREERRIKLREIIESTIKEKRFLLIPAFSLERTQMIVYEMNELFEKEGLQTLPVFIDSPLATKITKVYKKHIGSMNKKIQEQIASGDDVFNFPRLKFTPQANDSAKIAMTPNPKIVLAGSGMSQGGRIVHHEREHLSDEKATILMVGYQSAGSLGRQLQDGAKKVSVYGQEVKVKARVETIKGYSSHKDSDNLVSFVEKATEKGTLKKVFVVMGEPKSSLFLVQRLRDELNIDAVNPEYRSSVEI